MKRLLWLLPALLLLTGCSASYSRQQLLAALKENPDAVLAALGERRAELFELVARGQADYQERQRKLQLQRDLKNPLSPKVEPGRPLLGPAEAPNLVVAYSDFLCPYCARGAASLRTFLAAHPGEVRALFKHFAASEPSRLAALYFEAAGEQGAEAAWAFHDALFARQAEYAEKGEAALKETARQVGLNMARLARDLKRPELAARIEADVAEARAFGFDGTPTFVIDGLPLRGAMPPAEFDNVLKAAASGVKADPRDASCQDCLNK